MSELPPTIALFLFLFLFLFLLPLNQHWIPLPPFLRDFVTPIVVGAVTFCQGRGKR
jgi:hypothetical protein